MFNPTGRRVCNTSVKQVIKSLTCVLAHGKRRIVKTLVTYASDFIKLGKILY